jgi:Transaldolase/Fructose-6-phosphate aldolase
VTNCKASPNSATSLAIREKRAAGRSDEELFFDIALDDITAAADLFLPVHMLTDGVDGWVSLEVSPKLAYTAAATLAAARALHQARAVSRGGGCVLTRPEAPPRCWPEPCGRIGRLAVHQPMGCGRC